MCNHDRGLTIEWSFKELIVILKNRILKKEIPSVIKILLQIIIFFSILILEIAQAEIFLFRRKNRKNLNKYLGNYGIHL